MEGRSRLASSCARVECEVARGSLFAARGSGEGALGVSWRLCAGWLWVMRGLVVSSAGVP